MKKPILYLGISIVAFLIVCALYFGGAPAAENREAMYARSKVFQDSIANQIKTSMDQAAAQVPGGQIVPAVNPTATPTTTK